MTRKRGALRSWPRSECPNLSSRFARRAIAGVRFSRKVSEYLNAGVLVVVVLDPEPQIVHVFSADDPPRSIGVEEELILPGVLQDFRVRVGRFFE